MNRIKNNYRVGPRRRGISLIEVIACTAIVAVMIVPIASVLRSSATVIDRSSRPDSASTQRSAIRWIRDSITHGQVLDVGATYVTFLDATGRKVQYFSRNGDLLLTDGTNDTLVLQGVKLFEVKQHFQVDPPTDPIGMTIHIAGYDPQTSQEFDQQFSVSTPTAF